jgi:hypothetical protein
MGIEISSVEKWAEFASRVASVESLPYGEEQKSALKTVVGDVRQWFVALESESLYVKPEDSFSILHGSNSQSASSPHD